jgi:hypothetical protein
MIPVRRIAYHPIHQEKNKVQKSEIHNFHQFIFSQKTLNNIPRITIVLHGNKYVFQVFDLGN